VKQINMYLVRYLFFGFFVIKTAKIYTCSMNTILSTVLLPVDFMLHTKSVDLSYCVSSDLHLPISSTLQLLVASLCIFFSNSIAFNTFN
jgi:hypothetical protein